MGRFLAIYFGIGLTVAGLGYANTLQVRPTYWRKPVPAEWIASAAAAWPAIFFAVIIAPIPEEGLHTRRCEP